MTAEQQGLREREEQWNRASEIPDTILHRQSKSEATWAQEKHIGTGGWAGLGPVLRHGEQVLSEPSEKNTVLIV